MSFIPDKNHPIWNIIKGLISLITLSIWIWHMHTSHIGLDMSDASGVIGAGFAVKLIKDIVS